MLQSRLWLLIKCAKDYWIIMMMPLNTPVLTLSQKLLAEKVLILAYNEIWYIVSLRNFVELMWILSPSLESITVFLTIELYYHKVFFFKKINGHQKFPTKDNFFRNIWAVSIKRRLHLMLLTTLCVLHALWKYRSY